MAVVAKKHLTVRPDTNERKLVAKVTKLTNRLAFVTELGRMVRDVVKDPIERDKCYWKIIEAADYSDEWHDSTMDLSLNALLIDLRFGRFKDVEVVHGESQEVLLQLQDVQGD